ncbi:MAG: MurR/RpiR family transcriptional regulator [Atopostipes sp.]|nr:MurR/RpiR family transcriptional regulator [Atopostipes sp.]
MTKFKKSVIPIIESVYDTLTDLEKVAADFFIKSPKEEDLSAKNVSKQLHISEASLTRFAKKCGYAGYRQFRYEYLTNVKPQENIQRELTKRVLSDYEEILNKTYSLIDEEQIETIIDLLIKAKKVFFYGIGSSGLVAEEMKSRFMRIGLFCDAFTDPDLMKMNSALVDENCLIIALSISSNSSKLNASLKQAYDNKAKTILFTANNREEVQKYSDQVILVATSKNLSYGNRITPQFPLLVMVDIFYTYFLRSDIDTKGQIFSSTLSALRKNNDNLSGEKNRSEKRRF